jgi:hypothetical protein
MGFDEGLADRVRCALESKRGVTETKMFGGLAFLLNGKMLCGIVKDELMVRLGPDREREVRAEAHVRPMDFTGRPLKGFVFVAAEGLDEATSVERWVSEALRFAAKGGQARAKKAVAPSSKQKKGGRGR